MLGLGGMFHCLDAKTGRVLWKHDFQKEYWGVEKSKLGEDAWFPACGATASALVDGDQVIIPVGGKKAGAFVGFDHKTGKLLWKALDDRSSYASPLFADLAGTRQLVGFTGTRMVGLDAASHTLLWDYPFTALHEQTIVTPVIWKNYVIVCGEAKPTHALEITREGGKVTQIVAWQNADLSAYLVTPIVISDHLIGYDQRGKRLVSVDLATGKTVWASPRFGRIFASLVVVGKHLLVLSDSGELYALAADPKQYTPLGNWKVADPGAIWSQLAVVGNRIYIKDKEHLACYEFPG
jgi:outer membrane protein assembly factor BamB